MTRTRSVLDSLAGPIRKRLAVLLLVLLALSAAVPARGDPDRRQGSVDSVVVIVSADRAVTEISRLQLADIYLGRASRLPDGGPVVPVDQAPGSPAREIFYEEYLDRSQAEVRSHWSKLIFTGRGRPPRDLPGDRRVKERVASDPRAIGYVDVSLVDESVRIVRVR